MRKCLIASLILVILWSGIGWAAKQDKTGSFITPNKKGSLVIVGGNLDPANDDINEKFISLGQKRREVAKQQVKIAVIPVTSSTPSRTGRLYKEDFTAENNIPAENIKVFPLAVVDDRNTPQVDEATWRDNAFGEKGRQLARELATYDAVIFPGGDQLRVKTAFKGKEGRDSPVLQALRKIYKTGGVIAGSSAGAAMMSDPMLVRGHNLGGLQSGVTYEMDDQAIKNRPRTDQRVYLTKGMGFLYTGLVDTHFIKRGRIGRLIAACLNHDLPLGFGLAENTGIIVTGNQVEVVGQSGIVVCDLASAEHKWSEQGLKAQKIKIHYLERGDKFNLTNREVTVDSRRTKITTPQYKPKQKIKTIFAAHRAKQALTKYLVDNKQQQVTGLGFPDWEQQGFKFIFTQQASTQGFKGQLQQPTYYPGQQKTSYTVTNAYLTIKPTTRRFSMIKFNEYVFNGQLDISLGVETDEPVIQIAPDIKYTGIKDWEFNLYGKLEKDRNNYDYELDEPKEQGVVVSKSDGVKTDVGLVAEANYETELMNKTYLGVENSWEWEQLENKQRYYTDPLASDYNQPETIFTTTPYFDFVNWGLEIDNQLEITNNYEGYHPEEKDVINTLGCSYETELGSSIYAGLETSYEVKKTGLAELNDFQSANQETTAAVEPYLDLAHRGWKLGVKNEYITDNTLSETKYDDTEAKDIIITPYLDYEREIGPIMWGVKSDYELEQTDIKYTSQFSSRILTVQPYIDVFALELPADISLDIYSELELRKGAEKSGGGDLLLKTKAFYKDYRVGLNGIIKRNTYDSDEEDGYGVKPFIEYEASWQSGLNLNLNLGYKLVNKNNSGREENLLLTSKMSYQF